MTKVAAPAAKPANSETLVVGAASLGTMFEWYDFYLYGALATYIARHFFSGVNETTAFIFALAAFAAGFIVRPLGAIVFGRIGDIVGRKNTFLVTMGVMGVSTFIVGLLPGYAQIGVAAPAILIGLRLLQGLAIGGEYGGAAIYVAEHAAQGKRGFRTSWIQTTAALGLLLSLLVIMGARATMSPDSFEAWGWRIPFLLSIILLGISLWIRMKLNESPVFQRMKDEGATSKAPFKESFGRWPNLKIVLIALFGCVAGQAVTFYAGTFYTLFYLERILKVDGFTANWVIAVALVIGAPLYVFWGWLSDRVGRKPIIMTGLGLAVLLYFPLFAALEATANPALVRAQLTAPVSVFADPEDCSLQFDPVGRNKFDAHSCDIIKSYLSRASVNYENVSLAPGSTALVLIGDETIVAPDPRALSAEARDAAIADFQARVSEALTRVGYPAAADPQAINYVLLIMVIVALMTITTMCYGPIAALLVELFPARVRYTSMSLPYHIGNGWFGGFLPTTSFAIIAATGNVANGLWYPIVVAAMSLVVGLIFLPETKGRRVDHEH